MRVFVAVACVALFAAGVATLLWPQEGSAEGGAAGQREHAAAFTSADARRLKRLQRHDTPEAAALAAAARVYGPAEGRTATVVLRFPPPDQNEVRVRVEGDFECLIWGAVRDARGWVAGGIGREGMC